MWLYLQRCVCVTEVENGPETKPTIDPYLSQGYEDARSPLQCVWPSTLPDTRVNPWHQRLYCYIMP